MKQVHVAILGATGAVGREMMKILEERNFPAASLHPLASARSAGMELPWRGGLVRIREACDEAFAGMDLVLGAAEADVARRFAPAIARAGAIFVDNSSAFRLEPDVPLVIPEINPGDAARHHGILSNPNCTTVISLTAIYALHALSPITSITASSYQAVSGAGSAGLAALREELEALLNGHPCPSGVFPRPIACNVIPQIGSPGELDYTAEEMKLRNEGRKILHQPALQVSCTCVRVPVMRSHSVSLLVRTRDRIPAREAQAAIARAAGCRLMDDLPHGIYPTPLDASGQDLVLVGRIRKDLTGENGLCLWCCGDQLRKGAATNAVQIAELLLH